MAEQIVIAEGFEEASRKLFLVSERLRNIILRRALAAMLKVYKKGIQDRVVGRGLYLTGTLYRSVKTSTRTTGPAGLRGAVRIGSRVKGGGARDAKGAARGAFYAHMLEGGSKPHPIRAGQVDKREGDFGWRRTRALRIQGQFVAGVKHPGVRAYRMVADTFASDSAEAERRFMDYVDAAVESIVEQRATAARLKEL